ncbi:2-iminobutanoate/2-iminopropanoate deaminase-like [Paramacrobiotus metropolitanus]|uniref:2-iminobutanoate/2-iminopropanoate deaminase-like n=1 Tax=Paramacrobiotus metropolitanus TaxID=2943436 RepID=UPI002446366C|nr:2-iminobutanoate/2-iminopropanoate deaminase-like [Paramacrobiotus metropolitanus]
MGRNLEGWNWREALMAAVAVLACAAANSNASADGDADVGQRSVIFAPDAPRPLAPYSHAIRAGRTIYLSGQLGLDPVSNTLVTGGVEKEAEQALKNIGAVLRAAGANYSDVVKVTAIFADLKDFAAVNAIYARYFPQDPPARTGFQAEIPAGALVELEAIAVLPPPTNNTGNGSNAACNTSASIIIPAFLFFLRHASAVHLCIKY